MPGLLVASVSRASGVLRPTAATSAVKTTFWGFGRCDVRHSHSGAPPDKADIPQQGETKGAIVANSLAQGGNPGQGESGVSTKIIGGIVVIIGLALLFWWRTGPLLDGGDGVGGNDVGRRGNGSEDSDNQSVDCAGENDSSDDRNGSGDDVKSARQERDKKKEPMHPVLKSSLQPQAQTKVTSKDNPDGALTKSLQQQQQRPSTSKLESVWSLLKAITGVVAGAVFGVSAVSTVAAACSRMRATPDAHAQLTGEPPTALPRIHRVAQPPPPPQNDWFSDLFGFSEVSYPVAKQWLRIVPGNAGGGEVLESLANGARYDVGIFETPSLSALRARGASVSLPGRLTVTNELGDVAEKHNDPENRHGTFQVASQFNCLEFTGPRVTPEDGVTGYVNDRTQGPACSIACGPATAFRNFFAPVDAAPGSTVGPQEGQTQHRMIDNLADFSEVVGNVPEGRFFRVQGGYSIADEQQLAGLNAALRDLDAAKCLDEARRAIRIGIHQDVQVTSTSWGQRRVAEPEQKVTQAFVSACAVAYNKQSNPKDGSRKHAWERFGRIVLEACYEATLLAGLEAAVRHRGQQGSRRVFLTCVGGGVFGNPMEWIADAMRTACEKFKDCDLDVRVVTYAGSVDPLLRLLEQDFRATDPTAVPVFTG